MKKRPIGQLDEALLEDRLGRGDEAVVALDVRRVPLADLFVDEGRVGVVVQETTIGMEDAVVRMQGDEGDVVLAPTPGQGEEFVE